MRGLETFLENLGAKKTSKGDEWLMDCWECGDRKLYFNIQKITGFCVKCWVPRTLQDIAKQHGIARFDILQFIQDIKLEEMRTQGLRDTVLQGLLGRERAPMADLPEVLLPSEYRTLREGKESINGKQALAYMVNRGFDPEVLFYMGFGYCATGYYRQRVVIPFYENGRLVYWQARDYTGTVDPKKKILNPPSWLVSTGKTEVLFNSEAIKKHEVAVMTESWGSSLAVGRMSFAINGFHMSERQFELIKQAPVQTVIVMLDPGQELAAWNTAKRLSECKRVLVAELKGGDPNEVSRNVLFNTLREAVPYTSNEFLKRMARFKLPGGEKLQGNVGLSG